MAAITDFDTLHVIAPNFKRRLSGVTSTIIQLVPAQAKAGIGIAVIGPGLPPHLPHIRKRDIWRLWKRPSDGKPRVWHARRNVEMIGGIILRDLLRMPLRLVFTSAAQRNHRALTKWMIAKMDGVIATSEKSGSYLSVPHTVIMHGIDTNRFVPPSSKDGAKRALGLDPDRKIFGCTGRIRPSKGTDLFVDAMISLLPENPQWDAIIAGRATPEFLKFRAELESRVTKAGLSERIRFVGEVDDILPWYQAFDIFVAPSRNEGFGLTPLEAMACGVPCVTSDAGSYAEMVEEGVTGHKAPAGNAIALREAIRSTITELTSQFMGMRDLVSAKFSLQREVCEIGEIYHRLRSQS